MMEKTISIMSLPDEVLHRILEKVPCEWDEMDAQLRTTLPLVCKKWREIHYLQSGH